jgi:hypothetical protein
LFKSSSPFLNLVLNFFIAAFLFWLFQSWGWINITSELSIWVILLIAGFVNIASGLLVALVSVILSPVIGFLTIITLGLALPVFYALANYFTLKLTGIWTHLFTLTEVWWQVLILGLAFFLLRFSTPKED